MSTQAPVATGAAKAKSPARIAPVLPIGGPHLAARLRGVVSAVWRYLRHGAALPVLARRNRRLRVAETVSLGEKRFVSILEVDGQAFLLGGSGSQLALLATLSPEAPPFERVLRDSLERGESQ